VGYVSKEKEGRAGRNRKSVERGLRNLLGESSFYRSISIKEGRENRNEREEDGKEKEEKI